MMIARVRDSLAASCRLAVLRVRPADRVGAARRPGATSQRLAVPRPRWKRSWSRRSPGREIGGGHRRGWPTSRRAVACESGRDPLRRGRSSGRPEPGDPDFVPNEYATGVVVDRRGPDPDGLSRAWRERQRLLRHHVRPQDLPRAKVKAADPRSDLAVLDRSQADADFVPITLGDASKLKKGPDRDRPGQSLRALPATARPAPVGASSPTWPARRPRAATSPIAAQRAPRCTISAR